VVRIGTSEPAPSFRLVAQPSDWEKAVRTSGAPQRAKKFTIAAMERPTELTRQRRIAWIVVTLLLLVGGGLVVYSLLGSEDPLDRYSVAYDFGLGALIATGIATVLAMFLSRLEKQEDAYRAELREQEAARSEAQREELERARRAYETRWTDIQKQLDQLGRDMDNTILKWAIEDEARKIRHLIVDTVEPILEQLYEFRTNVDPKFEHPHKPIVDAVMELLRLQVGEVTPPPAETLSAVKEGDAPDG
jgi:ActR/RegA family two-component response regulator